MTEVFKNRSGKGNDTDDNAKHIGYDDITLHIQKIKALLQEIDKEKESHS